MYFNVIINIHNKKWGFNIYGGNADMEFTQINILHILSKEAAVFFVAMLPLAEVKVAIPMGIARGMNIYHALLLGILGSMVPVPFILLLLRPIISRFRKSKTGNKIADWITHRVNKKSGKVRRYRLIGLFIFVAIPLPSTGVWTGSAIAAILDIRIKNAFITILLGNTVAAIIMTLLSHTALNLFG